MTKPSISRLPSHDRHLSYATTASRSVCSLLGQAQQPITTPSRDTNQKLSDTF